MKQVALRTVDLVKVAYLYHFAMWEFGPPSLKLRWVKEFGLLREKGQQNQELVVVLTPKHLQNLD